MISHACLTCAIAGGLFVLGVWLAMRFFKRRLKDVEKDYDDHGRHN